MPDLVVMIRQPDAASVRALSHVRSDADAAVILQAEAALERLTVLLTYMPQLSRGARWISALALNDIAVALHVQRVAVGLPERRAA